VATVKNEAPFLLEWVAYHKMIGFDNILIYQNDSDDYTDETLKIMRDLGIVKYFYNRADAGKHQIRAYKRASRQPEFCDARWTMALDLDEFLYVKVGNGRLSDLFRALPDSDVALINWRRFGNDGRVHIGKGLVTEQFHAAEPEARIESFLTPYKAIFRPHLFARCGIHQPADPLVPEERIITTNGSGLLEGEFERHRFRARDPNRRALAQVNHYIVRDAASFVLKSHRGSAHQSNREINQSYWEKRNFNDERDSGLSRQSPAIMAAMVELDAMSGGALGDLRFKALRLHRQRFLDLIKEPDYKELYEYCRASETPDEAAVHHPEITETHLRDQHSTAA
jgi:hypothetical protein